MRLGVAHEPLVGLDGDRAVGMVGAVEQRRREPVLVAAVGDLADELVDEVAAVGEDQDAAGSRGLDEADARRPSCRRRSRARTRSGGSAPGSSGASATTRPRPRAPPSPAAPRRGASASSSSATSRRAPFAVRALVGGRRPSPSPTSAAVATRSVRALGGRRVLELGGERGEGPGERVDLVLGELGAVRQQHRLGPRRAAARARAAASSRRRHSGDGVSAPASSSASAASTARRRAVPGARSSIVSPSSRIGSRVNSRTRSSSVVCDRARRRARGDVDVVSPWEGSSSGARR